MKDQEIIELIATKVMGWEREEPVTFMHKDDARFLWRGIDGNATWSDRFNPLDDDKTCMMAWDKFTQEHYYGRIDCVESVCYVYAYDKKGIEKYIAMATTPYTDRRRAMCECMAKVAGKEEGDV